MRRLLGAVLLAVLCLGPYASARAADQAHTVLLVVDASGSMQGERVRAAQEASLQFLGVVPAEDPIGLVTFARQVKVVVPPTTDRALVEDAIRALRPTGDTALFDGVSKAVSLAQGAAGCTVLLLADGEDTVSRSSRAAAVAAIRESGCTVNAVALRASNRTYETLRVLAAAGSGTAYTAYNAAEIASIFTSAIVSPSASATTTSPAPSTSSPAPEPSPSASTALGTAAVNTILLMLALLTGSGIFVFVWLALEGSNRSQRRRLERLIDNYAVQRVQPTEPEQRTLLETVEDGIRPLLAARTDVERTTMLLDGAAVDRSPEQWFLIRSGLLLALGALLGLASDARIPAMLLGAAVGWRAPQIWLGMRRRKRAKRFEEGLPDALMLMASSLRSGFALDQAIVAAADQADSEVATELKRAVQEIRIGVPLEDALDRAATRINSADFAWVVTALRIQRRSGGNLAELLVTVSKTVRQRAELAREVKALTAEGRMSAYVLIALPLGLFAFLLVSQPSYLTPLWSTPAGWALSGVAVVMLAIGWLLMQRMIKVDV